MEPNGPGGPGGGIWDPDGKAADFWVYGNTVFFALTQSMMLRAMILIDSWNWLGVFCAWFQY